MRNKYFQAGNETHSLVKLDEMSSERYLDNKVRDTEINHTDFRS